MKYVLNGFGYKDLMDFKLSVFPIVFEQKLNVWLLVSVVSSGLNSILLDYTGLDTVVFIAFVALIMAEFYTGLMVSIKIKGEKFKSRKFGRMVLKVGVYVFIISLLHSFSKGIDAPDVFGFQISPFLWLYYTVFTAIVFQLFISWMENLGCLGYTETKSIAGFILRKFNRWFELDGKKDNGKE